MAAIPLHALDHVVLTVKSIPRAVTFYTAHFGMRHETFSAVGAAAAPRHSLVFGQQKINLHEVGSEFLPRANLAKPGTADLCFLTRSPIETVQARLQEAGVKLETLVPEEGMLGGQELGEKWQDWEEEGKGRGKGEGVTGAIVDRTGARGKLRSVYLRDPDENLIEVSNYAGDVD